MMVPLFSASAANANLDLLTPLKRVLDSAWYVLGREVTAFEQEFADYVGVAHCVSVANGTDALELALRAAGVKPGDLVVTVANAGFYSSTAIYAVGATPLYVDIDSSSLTMAPAALAQALAQQPKAVIVTHLYGQLAAIQALCSLSQQAGCVLIEDCAQSHGAARDGQMAGSFGDIACFSFYPTKNLGALGDGGAVTTNSDDLAVSLKTLRQYGWAQKYHVTTANGKNSRLDEMQAAILRQKLPYLAAWNAERRNIARRYNQAFAGLSMVCPVSVGEDYVGHLYVTRVKHRDSFRAFLAKQEIASDVHYPVPDHWQTAYTALLSSKAHLVVTEQVCSELVTLPCFPGMTDNEIDRVISAVTEFFRV